MHNPKEVSSFLGGWISTSVHPSGLKDVGDLTDAKVLADKCVALASAQDISRTDIEAEVGDLAEHMRKALNIAQRASDAFKASSDWTDHVAAGKRR